MEFEVVNVFLGNESADGFYIVCKGLLIKNEPDNHIVAVYCPTDRKNSELMFLDVDQVCDHIDSTANWAYQNLEWQTRIPCMGYDASPDQVESIIRTGSIPREVIAELLSEVLVKDKAGKQWHILKPELNDLLRPYSMKS
jgi:hypothetical protein